MNHVFEYLYDNGVTKSDYKNCLKKAKITKNCFELLYGLPKDKTEKIIISDANSFFIEEILSHFGLSESFDAILTNPASFSPYGRLVVQPYHHQTWCDKSAKNMCKGYILEDYVTRREKQ